MPINRMAVDGLRAFDLQEDGSWKQTPETKKVLNIIRQSGGKDFTVEAAPSVLLGLGGKPMWGTGGGVHTELGTYVDPIAGNVSTAAHEAMHASFPTEIHEDFKKGVGLEKLNDMEDAPLGNQLSAVRATIGMPVMYEESHAQGGAASAMEKAGFKFNANGYLDVGTEITGLSETVPAALTYPGGYRYGGEYDDASKQYEAVQNIGPNGRGYSVDEQNAIKRVYGNHLPIMKRAFKQGFSVIK